MQKNTACQLIKAIGDQFEGHLVFFVLFVFFFTFAGTNNKDNENRSIYSKLQRGIW